VEVVPPTFDVEIAGNPEHLGVVLLNLFRNAEQAGARLVRVASHAEASGNAVQLAIHDDGPGFDENERARLFDTFALSTKPSGSGLGLYLVRRYVELLGGRVETEASNLGGAGFRIRLPGRVVAIRSAS
jgi:signal transduction histidine kinase